jgi:urea transport system permease protein
MLASIVNPLILGISIGSILLISALGLAVIYGAAGVINMAHGEFIMLGAYSTYTLQSTMGMPFLLCIPCAFFIVGIIGFVIERNLIC